MDRETAALPGHRAVVGVLGGMGPLATVDFLRKVVEATPARRDQDHVPVVVSSIPQIPDRTAAFRGGSDAPLAAMVASGERLKAAGAGLVVVPCNTAHLWFDALAAALRLPMLHIVDCALDEVATRLHAGAPVGILATDATLASALYLNRGAQRRPAPRWVQPTAVEVVEQLMPGIEAVKAGRLGEGRDRLRTVAAALRRRGAAAIVLGCTEIPLVLDEDGAGVPVIDPTAALARAAVAWSCRPRVEAVA